MKYATNDKKVLVELVTRTDCDNCEQVRSQIEEYKLNTDQIDFRTYNLDKDFLPKEKRSVITPAVWIAGSLCYLGMLDIRNFRERIKQLTLDIIE